LKIIKQLYDVGVPSSISLFSLLSEVYRNYEWLPWKFGKLPVNFWDDMKNQRKFLEWAGKQLKIKEMEDWYKVSVKVLEIFNFQVENKDLSDLGGQGLLHIYNNSPSHLLATVFPEYEWLPWKFTRIPVRFWDNLGNQRKFVEWAGKQLKLNKLEDWYKVSFKVTRYL
jgi:hypothetical protein